MAVIELNSRNAKVEVDDRDLKWVNDFTWLTMALRSDKASGKFYVFRWEKNKEGDRVAVYLHKEVLQRNEVLIPEGYIVDHIDGNPYNCTFANLRAITRKEKARLEKIVSAPKPKAPPKEDDLPDMFD